MFEVERRPALSGASGGGASEEADQGVAGAAPRARRVERVGGTSGGVHAAPRSPAGRGTGRAGVRGAVVARVVVVVARPVVRHTRPTPARR